MEREPVPRCLVQGTPDQRRVAMQLIREVMEVRAASRGYSALSGGYCALSGG